MSGGCVLRFSGHHYRRCFGSTTVKTRLSFKPVCRVPQVSRRSPQVSFCRSLTDSSSEDPGINPELLKILSTRDISNIPKELVQKYGGEQSIINLWKYFDDAQFRATLQTRTELFRENLGNLPYPDLEGRKTLSDNNPNPNSDQHQFLSPHQQQQQKEQQKKEQQMLTEFDNERRAEIQKEEENEKKFGKIYWIIGLLMILYIAYRRKKRKIERKKENSDYEDWLWSESTVSNVKRIPTRALSRMWGVFAGWEAPWIVQVGINRFYAWFFDCNLEEAEKPIDEYKSLGEFFCRRLKPSARSIDEDALLVSPVDGRVVHYGLVQTDFSLIEQVKGVSYSLSDFLGEDSPLYKKVQCLRVKENLIKGPINSELFPYILYENEEQTDVDPTVNKDNKKDNKKDNDKDKDKDKILDEKELEAAISNLDERVQKYFRKHYSKKESATTTASPSPPVLKSPRSSATPVAVQEVPSTTDLKSDLKKEDSPTPSSPPTPSPSPSPSPVLSPPTLVQQEVPPKTKSGSPSDSKQKDKNFYYCVIYLAPGDYHGYHSPTDWTIKERRHFPGDLFPVSHWSVARIRGVFAHNERVALEGEWKYGAFSFTPVGAYNVGSMDLAFEKDFITNTKNKDKSVVCYSEPVDSKKGENIGSFHMGSTIVLIFEGPELLFMKRRGEKIKLGETLAVLMNEELAQKQKKRRKNHEAYEKMLMERMFQQELKAELELKEDIKRTEEKWSAYNRKNEQLKELRRSLYPQVEPETVAALNEKKEELKEKMRESK